MLMLKAIIKHEEINEMGYKQLCIIREKEVDWQEVIRLAKEAKSTGWPDGTAGGWDRRIVKARKMAKKLCIDPVDEIGLH